MQAVLHQLSGQPRQGSLSETRMSLQEVGAVVHQGAAPAVHLRRGLCRGQTAAVQGGERARAGGARAHLAAWHHGSGGVPGGCWAQRQRGGPPDRRASGGNKGAAHHGSGPEGVSAASKRHFRQGPGEEHGVGGHRRARQGDAGGVDEPAPERGGGGRRHSGGRSAGPHRLRAPGNGVGGDPVDAAQEGRGPGRHGRETAWRT